jgi:hypothetical protein
MRKEIKKLMQATVATAATLVLSPLALAQSIFSPDANIYSFRQIQTLSGWQSCGSCAGIAAAGPTSTHTMTRFISSPSLSGASSQYTISSSSSYADALWWKQLGRHDGVTRFVYDVFFFIKNPSAAQALEFDVNYADGVHRWIFGTQCNIAGGHWDIYGNASGGWRSTGVGCAPPKASTWHHLVWEFKRSSNQVVFVAFTYDGVRHTINRSFPAKSSTVHELNVAFQMDMTKSHTTYSTWLDKATLLFQ